MSVARYNGGDSLVRIWMGELPDAAYDVAGVLERSVTAAQSATRTVRMAAVERFQQVGPMCWYALLGASFTPDAKAALRVRVAFSENDDCRFEGALVWGDEAVWVGLPEEYAQEVLEGALEATELESLGGGVLHFGCAALGEISSARMPFRIVARRVVRLLSSYGSAEEEMAR